MKRIISTLLLILPAIILIALPEFQHAFSQDPSVQESDIFSETAPQDGEYTEPLWFQPADGTDEVNINDLPADPENQAGDVPVVEIEAEPVPDSGSADGEQIKAGSIIRFGHYEQDNDPNNGIEPVEWIVLTTDWENHRALLLSRYALHEVQFNYVQRPDVTWDNSSLREWMNKDLLAKLFNEAELSHILPVEHYGNDAPYNTENRAMITDDLFVLSIFDLSRYASNDELMKCGFTPVTRGRYPYSEYAQWWLRDSFGGNASAVSEQGVIQNAVTKQGVFVRPAFWLDISGFGFLPSEPEGYDPTGNYDDILPPEADGQDKTPDPVINDSDNSPKENGYPDDENAPELTDPVQVNPPEGQDIVPEPSGPSDGLEKEPGKTEQTIHYPKQGPAFQTDTTPEPGLIEKITSKPWLLLIISFVITAAGVFVFLSGRSKQGSRKKTGAKKNNSLSSIDEVVCTTSVIIKEGAYVISGCLGQGKRDYQEDSLWFSEDPQTGEPVCAVIADGMGGMENGAASSAVAIDAVRKRIEHVQINRDIPSKLWQICNSANSEVYEMNTQLNKNGGATLIIAFIVDNMFYWVSVGDSRIYLYRDGMLAMVNEEHELENRLYTQMLDDEIDLIDIRETPDRELRKLTSNLGRNSIPLIDQNFIPYRLHIGDKILLCSDGVSGTLSENELLKCLNDPDPEVNCGAISAMIDDKNKRGQDNYSAIVVSVKTEGLQ